MVAALEGGQLVASDDEGTSWRDLGLAVEHSEIVALTLAPDGTVFVATASSVELTLWRWENLRGWSRLLVEPSMGVPRVALGGVVIATDRARRSGWSGPSRPPTAPSRTRGPRARAPAMWRSGRARAGGGQCHLVGLFARRPHRIRGDECGGLRLERRWGDVRRVERRANESADGGDRRFSKLWRRSDGLCHWPRRYRLAASVVLSEAGESMTDQEDGSFPSRG